MIVSPSGRQVCVIGLAGSESVGKTTLSLALAGRLRMRGRLASVSAEPGSTIPFDVAAYDAGNVAAWTYAILGKIERDVRAMTVNVDTLICDRVPVDFVAQHRARFPDAPLEQAYAAARWWTGLYDHVYLLPTADAPLRLDGFRHTEVPWRASSEAMLVEELGSRCTRVSGSFKERFEFVYHHVLSWLLGETRPLRAEQQVRGWLEQRGWRIVEIRWQGSNSVERFHAPTDNDDIDLMVVVDGDADYAIRVRADIEAHRVQLENIVQADLDLLVTPRGLEAHEV